MRFMGCSESLLRPGVYKTSPRLRHLVSSPNRKNSLPVLQFSDTAFTRSYRLTPCENQMNSIKHEAASSGHRIFLVAVRLASRPSKEM